ncbi:MAG: hypothetical protein AB7N76_18485 [Planctomycetota bacterium]
MSAPTPTPTPTPLVTHDELVGAKDLAALEALYRERGAEGDREAVLQRAREDWHRLAVARAEELQPANPARFEPDRATRGGVEFRVYGICHGILGGNDEGYKEFVDAALRDLDLVAFENALYFYPAKRRVMIPDFLPVGAVGSLRLGIYVGTGFPLLFLELLGDLFKRGSGPDELAGYDYSPRYHALPVETRRGLEEDPPLPSHLQVEYEMTAWDAGPNAVRWRDPTVIVPRSMFMAGFAVGYARSRKLSALDMVVGDLHTGEVLHFLRDEALDHPLFRAGQAWGERSDSSRFLGTILGKVEHLGISGVVGSSILVALLGLLLFLARLGLEYLALGALAVVLGPVYLR